MPTNLPAEAKHKWSEVSATRNPREKLRLLREFLSMVPKHKGTAKLCAQVKRQMAVLRREIEEGKRRKTGRSGPRFFIEKEGAAQVVVLGPTKVGRSSLLASITNAKVEVSEYPFTTKRPVPGMLQYQDVQLQIVEAPALMKGSAEGEAWGPQTLALARNSDGLILMVDLSRDPCEQLALILEELSKVRILVERPRARVEIERKHVGFGIRITVIGSLVGCAMDDVKRVLKEYGVTDALVRIHGEATIDDVEDAVFENVAYRPAIVVANKADVEGAKAGLKALEDFVNGKLKIIPISCRTGANLGRLGEELFRSLGVIRVYTKEPGEKEPSSKPFVLKRGATVLDVAKLIHSDFVRRFSYARVWSRRLKFSPQKVGLSFLLDDGDVVEIRVR